jgi:hypothetical protein
MIDLLATGAVVLGAAGCVFAVAILRRRRAVQRREGGFACRIRPVAEREGSGRARAAEARWVHDVLVLRYGPLRATTRVLGVRTAYGVLEPTMDITGRRRSVSLRLTLDDGSTVDVIADADCADDLAGPFMTAAGTLARARPADRP